LAVNKTLNTFIQKNAFANNRRSLKLFYRLKFGICAVLLVKESSGKSNLVMKVAGLPSPIFLGHLGRMKSKLFEEKVQYITYDKTMQFHLSKG